MGATEWSGTLFCRSFHSFCLVLTMRFVSAGGVCFGGTGGIRGQWTIGDGSHAGELGLSVYTLLISCLACFVGFLLDQQFRDPDSVEEVNVVMRDAEMMRRDDFEEAVSRSRYDHTTGLSNRLTL